MPHIERPRVTRHTPVHVTMRCVDGLPTLRRSSHKRLIESIFRAESRKGFRLVHYSIQSNHLHLICEGDDTRAVSRGVQRIASRMARQLNRRFGRKGKLFRERFHSSLISTPRQMRNALRYVLLNLHKHRAERGQATSGLDPYSSADRFDGWRRPPAMSRPPPGREQQAAVVPPQAWVARTGWRKHGLLEPAWV